MQTESGIKGACHAWVPPWARIVRPACSSRKGHVHGQGGSGTFFSAGIQKVLNSVCGLRRLLCPKAPQEQELQGQASYNCWSDCFVTSGACCVRMASGISGMKSGLCVVTHDTRTGFALCVFWGRDQLGYRSSIPGMRSE